MSLSISIIGGGISGLYAAKQLAEQGHNVHLYEKQSKFGGRFKTIYENGIVSYESGPWRIHPTHKRFLQLVKDLKLTLVPTHHKIQRKGFRHTSPSKTPNRFPVSPMSMTIFQENCLHEPLPVVKENIQKTGYDGIFQEPYESNSNFIETDEDFFVVKEGFNEIIEKLVRQLESLPNVTLHTNHFIRNISYDKKGYTITFTVRKKNVYEPHEIKTKFLVLAIPPCDLEKIKSLTLHPNLATVGSTPLLHTFAKSKDIGKSFGKIICNSPLSQIISTCYNNDWFQISYTGGRLAMLFHNLYISSKSTWKKYMISEFYTYFPKSIHLEKIVPHFWRHAVHYWHPNYKMKKKTLSERNILPHPQKYKHLYCVGESISTHQAWTEGALETVETFMNIFNKHSKPTTKKPKDYVIYDGRVLNVGSWKFVHPGSREVLENHMGEDITDLWNQYHPITASKYFIALEQR